jgi:DNA-binding response OmpR family regulator
MEPRTPLEPFIGDRSPRVLAVDDEPANLQILSAMLTRWRCTVSTAGGGAEALAAVKAESPDIILLDVMMPGQSGFEVCRLLQADPATAHIPVVFLTALSGGEALREGFETGGRDFIAKPFNARELAARVGARLRQKYAEDVLREQRARLSAIVVGQRPPRERPE